MLRTRYLLIGAAVLLVLIFEFMLKNDRLNNTLDMYKAVSDSLRITRNDLGQQIAEKNVIESYREKDFLRIQTQDAIIKDLQKTVKRYEGKLQTAIISTNTTNTLGSNTTVILNDSTGEYPVYKTTWDSKWDKGSIIASKDSIIHNIKIRNKFKFVIGKKSNGWFKK